MAADRLEFLKAARAGGPTVGEGACGVAGRAEWRGVRSGGACGVVVIGPLKTSASYRSIPVAEVVGRQSPPIFRTALQPRTQHVRADVGEISGYPQVAVQT